MSRTMQLKIKIQIYCGNEIAMGPGKADLLDAIREHGSISAAGRAMEMSYRRAWLLVDAMNRCWQEPLVHTAPGRAEGSGARLTAMGERVLAHYRALQATLSNAAEGKDCAVLSQLLLTEPRVSQKA
ncbi:winged helix-turn-helix domain-containing protein [Novosphingobium album (ex Hu et al. 2023)]|uniref:Winged helix-turn-helix domain-containing protein n=1 Tax=Novosphingobium album (ex Hu et al. 2023) TaxID=2930093 RepID=A0ABT0AXZ4_9SPHN|nr:winged helix-turn-helix domain-containing protein [Novosphingobium album (ex Hu et al. 2023)]MCJ2177682.1 winged helix-turn-helix domain-containing protein [Novosphingobium album (ex Hu et al. 2023)]